MLPCNFRALPPSGITFKMEFPLSTFLFMKLFIHIEIYNKYIRTGLFLNIFSAFARAYLVWKNLSSLIESCNSDQLKDHICNMLFNGNLKYWWATCVAIRQGRWALLETTRPGTVFLYRKISEQEMHEERTIWWQLAVKAGGGFLQLPFAFGMGPPWEGPSWWGCLALSSCFLQTFQPSPLPKPKMPHLRCS